MSIYPNRINDKRTALKLSQRELAKVVGTSQQQIQRIEAGVQAVRLELAAKIATALESSIAEVFPKVGKTLSVARRTQGKGGEPPSSAGTLAEVGIESDPKTWTVRLGFDGDIELDFVVSSADKDRLSSIIWNATFDFIVFDTATTRVAVNRKRITYANLLFDFGIIVDEIENEKENESHKVIARFFGNKETVEFGVEPDDLDADADDQGFRSQFQNLFLHIDGTDADEDEVVWFDDLDGERVLIRKKQLVVLEVPLLCCEPALWATYIDSLDEEEETANLEKTDRESGRDDSK